MKKIIVILCLLIMASGCTSRLPRGYQFWAMPEDAQKKALKKYLVSYMIKDLTKKGYPKSLIKEDCECMVTYIVNNNSVNELANMKGNKSAPIVKESMKVCRLLSKNKNAKYWDIK